MISSVDNGTAVDIGYFDFHTTFGHHLPHHAYSQIDKIWTAGL